MLSLPNNSVCTCSVYNYTKYVIVYLHVPIYLSCLLAMGTTYHERMKGRETKKDISILRTYLRYLFNCAWTEKTRPPGEEQNCRISAMSFFSFFVKFLMERTVRSCSRIDFLLSRQRLRAGEWADLFTFGFILLVGELVMSVSGMV